MMKTEANKSWGEKEVFCVAESTSTHHYSVDGHPRLKHRALTTLFLPLFLFYR